MKIQQLLSHHGLSENPFSQEDAKEDRIFRQGCVDHTFHPSWDKIVGDPESPSSAVVFGEKGSGKTALRIQMVEHFKKFNAAHPDRRVLILEYDDFNPFLDQFVQKEANLARWELRDHMDAILSLGTRKVVNMILHEPTEISRQQIAALDRLQKRDLLLLAAIYDRSHDTTLADRWFRLRRALRFGWPVGGLFAKREFLLGFLATAGLGAAATYFKWWTGLLGPYWWLGLLFLIAVWLPALKQWFWAHFLAWNIDSSVRTLHHSIPDLRSLLLRFRRRDLDGQPICQLDTSDARYVLLNKLQSALRKLGFCSMVVIVDRVDEPYRVGGNAPLMHQLMRSIFDLKFLQHPDLGIKLLLPGDLWPLIHSERQDFRDRARLDKQHYIPSLEWTGQSLEDLVNDRLRACSANGQAPPTLRSLLGEGITDTEITHYLEQMKIPRHVFKFLYQLFSTHCNNYTEAKPEWTISRETFMMTWAAFRQSLQRYERGLLA
jgi:hypothetical protein